IDERVDLYALGAVGYFLLCGEPVFTGDTTVEVCSHHLHTRPQPPSERLDKTISDSLQRVILSCLEKDPKERPANAQTLVALLDGCDGVPPWGQEQAEAWWASRSALLARQVAPHVNSEPASDKQLAGASTAPLAKIPS
ncbi:MAG TPA: hypothetical protein VFQ61_32865, partial [Polyangiaceae bacterium]|nr:hypothetical protein [Polyangiaceae bacterium]